MFLYNYIIAYIYVGFILVYFLFITHYMFNFVLFSLFCEKTMIIHTFLLFAMMNLQVYLFASKHILKTFPLTFPLISVIRVFQLANNMERFVIKWIFTSLFVFSNSVLSNVPFLFLNSVYLWLFGFLSTLT